MGEIMFQREKAANLLSIESKIVNYLNVSSKNISNDPYFLRISQHQICFSRDFNMRGGE